MQTIYTDLSAIAIDQFSSYQQVNHNALNNSHSKQLYSFPKQSRFQKLPQPLTSRTRFYTQSSFDRNKTHAFSRTKRELMFQNQQEFSEHPPPNIYNCKNNNQFGQSQAGITISRKFKSYNKNITPGPPEYDTKFFDHLNKTVSFTKQKRQFKYPVQDRKGQGSPGPYLIQTSRLKNVLSNYKNIKNSKINKLSNTISLAYIHNNNKIREKLQNRKSKLEGTIKQKQNPQNLIPKNESFLKKLQVKSTFNNSILLKKQKSTVFGKQARKTCFDVKNDDDTSPAKYNRFSQFAKRNKPDVVSRSLKYKHTKSMKNYRIKTQTINQLKKFSQAH